MNNHQKEFKDLLNEIGLSNLPIQKAVNNPYMGWNVRSLYYVEQVIKIGKQKAESIILKYGTINDGNGNGNDKAIAQINPYYYSFRGRGLIINKKNTIKIREAWNKTIERITSGQKEKIASEMSAESRNKEIDKIDPTIIIEKNDRYSFGELINIKLKKGSVEISATTRNGLDYTIEPSQEFDRGQLVQIMNFLEKMKIEKKALTSENGNSWFVNQISEIKKEGQI